MKIDISGTVGDQAWQGLNHFADALGSRFGPEEGSGGPCAHGPQEPHAKGEWWVAIVLLEDFLAEYALPHYLEQPRVVDGYTEAVDERP